MVSPLGPWISLLQIFHSEYRAVNLIASHLAAAEQDLAGAP